jgi:alkaline phosphatase
MSLRAKKTFLLLSIVLPFLFYCIYYYGIMLKNAPYKFSEFDSITMNFGTGDSLINKYSSKTGDYQYVNSRDSLKKMHLRLTNDDFLILHRKAAELGFWDFPSKMGFDSMEVGFNKAPHYYMQFKYKRKTKTVLYDDAFNGDPKLKDAVQQMIKAIQGRLEEAENREKK